MTIFEAVKLLNEIKQFRKAADTNEERDWAYNQQWIIESALGIKIAKRNETPNDRVRFESIIKANNLSYSKIDNGYKIEFREYVYSFTIEGGKVIITEQADGFNSDNNPDHTGNTISANDIGYNFIESLIRNNPCEYPFVSYLYDR